MSGGDDTCHHCHSVCQHTHTQNPASSTRPTHPFNTLQGVSVDTLQSLPSLPLSYRTKWTKPDGNCQFIAFAKALRGQVTHQDTRETAVQWISDHPWDFMEAIASTGHADFVSYCDRMSALGQWGDDITLSAMAKAYQVSAYVLKMTPQGMVWLDKSVSKPKACIWLHLQDAHYENLLAMRQVHYL